MKLSSLFRLSILKAMTSGLADSLLASNVVPDEARSRLLRLRGSKVGELCTFSSGLQASSAERISIGSSCYLNKGCILQAEGGIEIGNHAYLGRNVTLVTINHVFGPSGQRAGAKYASPISIGSGSWLASNVTVLPGVSIGSGVIVAAGAVVAADLSDDALYAGVPARKLRDLPPEGETLIAQAAKEL